MNVPTASHLPTRAPSQPAAPADPGHIVVVGAGPAGLTAAHRLGAAGHTCTVLEAAGSVGGLSRTVEVDGYRFDIGGHRFFSKIPEVERLWEELLPDGELLTRPRLSRIHYRGRFFDYPLRPLNALANLGPVEAARCLLSFLWVRVRPPADRSTLEGYIVANYGRRLYEHFFETYTEKVWGVSAAHLSADWGAQRIKGMSLGTAVREALGLGRSRGRGHGPTSLIEQFRYPRLGPGQMWECCAEQVQAMGSKVVLHAAVTGVEHRDGMAVSVSTTDPSGARTCHPVDHLISSMPLPSLIQVMAPPPPAEVLAAADDLRYRDFLSVALVVPAERVPWSDNWIYVHEPGVRAMRVQNFGAWSPDLVREGENVLGLEYTVVEGDGWWTLPDHELVAHAARELEALGLVAAGDVVTGYVVREPKAYPVYDEHYRANVATLRRWLERNARNVHPVGRNGMHRYNNQDHSMYTAMLAVDNVLHGAGHDVWAVNVDADYHEDAGGGGARASAGGRGTGRDAPVLPRTVGRPA